MSARLLSPSNWDPDVYHQALWGMDLIFPASQKDWCLVGSVYWIIPRHLTLRSETHVDSYQPAGIQTSSINRGYLLYMRSG